VRRALAAAAALVLASGAPAGAADLCAGYSHLRLDGGGVHGAVVSVAWPMAGPLRLDVEASSQRGLVAGEDLDEHALLAGMALAPGRGRRLRPFLHARAGVAWSRRQVEVFGVAIGPGGVCEGGCPGRVGPAVAAGGGLDLRLFGRWSARLAQVDYRRTFLEGPDTSGLRAAAGVVFRWGR
jgi:hypothetical protein